jgi:predicted nucleic acid-binding protein
MKGYVVDANVIFSSLISGKEVYQAIFDRNKFYFPDFGLLEIQKYQSIILEKTQLSKKELEAYTIRLFTHIIVIPNFLISTRSYLSAFEWCKSIDENDVVYLALAIELNAPFISKDDNLVSGLRQKGFTNIMSFKEFINPYYSL